MKLFLKSLSVLIFFISLKAAAATLECKTLNKVSGWNGGRTFDLISIGAQIKGAGLANPSVSGAFEAHLLGTVLGKKSENGKWSRYSGMEDAWCWYKLIVPTGVATLSGQSFRGVLDRTCDESKKNGSYRLTCTVK